LKNNISEVIGRILYIPAKVYNYILDKFGKSIRLEIILVFIICIFTAATAGKLVDLAFRLSSIQVKEEQRNIINRLNDPAVTIAREFEDKKLSIKDNVQVEHLLQSQKTDKGYEVMIVSTEGKILYCTNNNITKKEISITALVRGFFPDTMQLGIHEEERHGKEFTSFYPISFIDEEAYIVVNNKVSKKHIISDSYITNSQIISVTTMFLVFISTFILLTNKKMTYLQYVSAGLLEISKGNLDYKIKKIGEDEIALLANNINYMAEELKKQIENERNAEKIKNELITNVSHDLRTPLTSIRGYLEVIRTMKNYDQEQLEQYISIVYNKSENLGNLIDDLFEYTKLVNNQIAVQYQEIDLNQLISQLMEELVPVCEENNLTMTRNNINDKILINLDPDKIVRIFENLLINAIKYSLKPSEIRINIINNNDLVQVSISNQCSYISEEELQRLFERFYRIDKDRSSSTGGSGLGLAIAKSLVTMQGGSIDVKYESGYIYFIVSFKII